MAKKDKDDEKSPFDTIDVKIERVGEKITLPAIPAPGMTYDEAIKALERIKKDESEEFAVREVIDGYYYLDGAVAFWDAIRDVYGYASPIPTKTFFGDKPPMMLTVQTGPDQRESRQVPFGEMKIPTFDNPVMTGVDMVDGMPVFTVTGKIKRSSVDQLKKLVERARDRIREHSIYRGKAFILNTDEPTEAPKFLNPNVKAAEELVLNRDLEALVNVSVLTPITHTDACIADGIPIKRGILLAGTYGTGKSLTGLVVARTAINSKSKAAPYGWTYILINSVDGLEHALRMAKHYAPAVVFAEDADRLLEERNDEANTLINTIDGVVSKNEKVITILTSNFAEKIDRAMLRPGRLDAVIFYRPPDAEAVQRLIRLYARNRLAEGETLEEIGTALDGEIPATIREVVERSKLAMISRGDTKIIEEDMLTTVFGMRQHLDLLKSEKKPTREDAMSKFADGLLGLIEQGAGLNILKTHDAASEMSHDNTQGLVKTSTRQLDTKAGERHMEVGKKIDTVDKVVKNIARAVGANAG